MWPPRGPLYVKPGSAHESETFSHGECPRLGGLRIAEFGLLVVFFLWSAVSARAEYRIQPGDSVELFVAEIPERQRRVPIELDGSISFPH
jgi:polysaccharide biosynthesis/export protein